MSTKMATVHVAGEDYTAVQLLNKRAERLDEILPGTAGITGAQLVRIAQFELQRNTDLALCDPLSVLNAVYDAARLGLMLGREAHLVPYREKCQMIPDYRGFVTLAYRSKLVTRIDAKLVFPQDQFTVEEGSTMAIHHLPDYLIDRSNPEEILYFYAIAWTVGAPVPVFHIMNRPEVDRIRASSAMKNGIPWTKWYDRMGLKSAMKYLVDKRLPVTEIPGLSDLVEIDNRAEAGKVSRPLTGESDEELAGRIDEETQVRKEDLQMKLDDAKNRQREPGEEG
ncbi:MAG: recombinase RecT [Nitrospirales bacterium]